MYGVIVPIEMSSNPKLFPEKPLGVLLILKIAEVLVPEFQVE